MRLKALKAFTILASWSVATGAGHAQKLPDSQMTIYPGGLVDLAVPDGKARAFAMQIASVDDANGTVASFRLETVRAARVVESRRMAVQEPGGIYVEEFQRPFDRLRIRDDEGTVYAKLNVVNFCFKNLYGEEGCLQNPDKVSDDGAITRDASGDSEDTSSTDEQTDSGTDNGDTSSEPTTDTTSTDDEPTGDTSGGGDEPTDTEEPTTSPGTDDTSEPTGEDPSTVDDTSGGTDDSEETVSEPEGDGRFHGMNTPIRRIADTLPADQVVQVQAGPYHAGYLPYMPWRNQAVLFNGWQGKVPQGYSWQNYLTKSDTEVNEHGIPLWPADAPEGLTYWSSGGVWFGSKDTGTSDIEGTWELTYDPRADLRFQNSGLSTVSESQGRAVFRCDAGQECNYSMVLFSAPADMRAPQLVQLTDKDGRSLRDANTTYTTRQRWREAAWGYNGLRTMDASGATDANAQVIRYDEFPQETGATWHARLTKGNGAAPKSFAPVVSRLKAAYEIGAVYHHNFPHLFLENKNAFDPELIGAWFKAIWDDGSIPLTKKERLLNDYELQHVDEFGADMLAHQDWITDNQIKVEVSNETWNYGNPWWIQTNYFNARADWVASRMGRPEPTGYPKEAIQTGYETVKAIARLRKKYPEIEWRGVFAVQTAYTLNWKGEKDLPDTPSGMWNRTLSGQMEGYRLFWQDYDNNEAEWSELYAPEPAKPGDWFEVQGTTYFGVHSTLSDMKTHFGGLEPDEAAALLADPAKWPELRKHLLTFFVTGPETPGEITDDGGRQPQDASLAGIKIYFRTLAEHANALGMEVTSYEGGNHSNPGGYYKDLFNTQPGLADFWFDFAWSTEMGLIQASVHDAAVESGWKGLADFTLFQGSNGRNIFGSRRHMADVTPRYCEYARWMSASPVRPVGLAEDAGLKSPHERCGGLIQYLNQAKANNYYVNQTIPAPETFLE